MRGLRRRQGGFIARQRDRHELASSHNLARFAVILDAPELQRELRKNPNFFASSFWSDGQVRLSGREFNGLRQSPCYTHGDTKRQLDCTSCHELHAHDSGAAWRDDQLRAGMRGNVACTQCHAQFAPPEALAAHTHHGTWAHR